MAIAYRRMDWQVLKDSLMDALEISAVVLLIVASSKAYSRILAITGISQGFAAFVADVAPSATLAVLIILMIVLVLGCFMDQTSVVFVAIPW